MTLHETLQESTIQLKQLGTTYGRMEDLLTSSRDLLGVLMKSTKSDTWYLQTTLYLLAATLAWLVFRRWLYGPLWWLVWLPLRLVFRTGSTAVGIAGGNRGGNSGAVTMMEVADGTGKKTVAVDMGREGASVPTAKVGGGEERKVASDGDPDSMMEMVGRIVDNLPEGQGDDEPAADTEAFVSTSDAEVAYDEGRVRDEL